MVASYQGRQRGPRSTSRPGVKCNEGRPLHVLLRYLGIPKPSPLGVRARIFVTGLFFQQVQSLSDISFLDLFTELVRSPELPVGKQLDVTDAQNVFPPTGRTNPSTYHFRAMFIRMKRRSLATAKIIDACDWPSLVTHAPILDEEAAAIGARQGFSFPLACAPHAFFHQLEDRQFAEPCQAFSVWIREKVFWVASG